MKFLTLIPSRTCVSLPNRHNMDVSGEPLLAYPIKAAIAACDGGDVVVASEMPDARRYAEGLGAKTCNIPLSLSGAVAPSSVLSYSLATVKGDYDAVLYVSEASPFITKEDIECVKAQLSLGKFQSVVTVSESRPTIMKALRKGRKGYWHEDAAKRNIYVFNEMIIGVMLPYFYETHKLIGAKGGIVATPPERSIVVKDAWDYMKAQGMADELRKIGYRKSEVR